MEEGAKNFVKEVKALPKKVRDRRGGAVCWQGCEQAQNSRRCCGMSGLADWQPLTGVAAPPPPVHHKQHPPTQLRDEDVLKGLDSMIKNFLVSMPLVADLRSPAMRPRHWQQLMDTTRVSRGMGCGVCRCWQALCDCPCATACTTPDS
jgi:hypothetical protein